jgi:hypothetical protein
MYSDWCKSCAAGSEKKELDRMQLATLEAHFCCLSMFQLEGKKKLTLPSA